VLVAPPESKGTFAPAAAQGDPFCACSSKLRMMLRNAVLLWVAAASAQPLTALPADGEIQRLPVIDKQDIRFDGLSIGGKPFQKRVFALAQDNYGFLWLGTDEGLYRYDGYGLRQYSHDPGNPRSLTDNTVMLIYKDRAGILWIGTVSGGLDRFDPAGDTFTHYRHDPNDSQSLRNDYIAALYQDRTGAMWVDTVDGFDRLDVASGRFFHYPDPAGEIERRQVVREFYEDSQGNLLVGYAQGLYKVDRASARLSRIWNSPRSGFSGPSNPGVQNPGVQWLPTRGGMAWFTSLSENMIGSVNTGNGRCTCYAPPWDGAHNPPSIEFHRILEDRSGVLWIGSRKGLFRVDSDRKNFVRYADQPDHGLGGLIWALLEDSEGNLWVGSEAGLTRFQTRPPAFLNYRKDPGNPNGLRSNKVLSVLSDGRGFLWIGTNAGLNRLDRKTGQVVVYQNNPRDTHSLSHNTVTAIKEDGTGKLWIGTQGGGLNRFDPGSGRFVAYRHNPADSQSLGSDDIRGLALSPGGVVWIATVGGGVNRFDPGTGRFKTYRNDPRIPGTLSEDVVFEVFIDRTGTLWAGTFWGLNRLDRDTERFTIYHHDEHNRASLSNDGITSIDEDHQGTLWIGTRAGLDRFDRNRDSFEPVTTRNGLANDYIQDIREDGRGHLWLATHEGLSEYDPRTGKVHNYSEADGLSGDFANPTLTERSAVTPEGELIFGSGYGLTMLNPARVFTNAFRPPVVLTNFFLFNQPVVPSRNSPLRRPIWATHALTLEHWQNQFTIEFSSLSYVAPQSNRYRYKLEGFEKSWNEVGADRRTATYTNLPPDKYVFRVQGSNDDLLWNDTAVSMEITVLPPWWGTWWFRSVAFLSVACLAFVAYQWRIRSLRLAAHRLELQVDQRTRELRLARDAADSANRSKSAFLANMSHELRTPLNSILGFSALLREGKASGEQQQRDLEMINRSGHHLLGLINNVLDLAKVESGRTELHLEPCDLKNLVAEIAEMIRVRADEKNVALRVVETPGSPRAVRTDGVKLRQVLINLLGNAVKFTEKGSVTLTVNSRAAEDGRRLVLIFEVEDTGIGIAADDQARIFDAFTQAGKPRTNKGTGLGLTISREFVKLMGGTIEVASTPGHGSRFRVELPADPVKESELPQPETEEGRIIGVELDRPDYRVLIVEDGEENRIVLQRLMENAGFQVRCGEHGAQGVEMFQSWRPHFIWMDLRMPVMDGKEAVRRIRDLDGGRNTKIVAVTASAFASERDDVMAAGMDDFIRKPYRPSEIFDCMARHLGLRRVFRRSQKEQRRVLLSKEGLEALPRELVGELQTAIVRLDIEQVEGVIARISQYDPEIGQQLTHMAAHFAYTAMLKAVQPEDDKSPGVSTVERT
jgi:signal transduction histidine kinase/ligand-binding sensor domain-containing protein/FixJ family two-component response regulator